MRPEHPPLRILIAVMVVSILILATRPSGRVHLSGWSPQNALEVVLQGAASRQGLSAAFESRQPHDPFTELRQAVAGGALPAGSAALEAYNQGSTLVDATPDQHVRYYTRSLAQGGQIAYVVVQLTEAVRMAMLTADGAIPASDAQGDTVWSDGQRHLATVEEMVHAPYAVRANMTLMAAMAVDYHGSSRTSPEGTTVIDGTVHHVNAGRAALCISDGGSAAIGRFPVEMLAHCDLAIGGGPVVLWRGKIANPDVAAETDAFVPYNPLGEDFVQIDWHRKAYLSTYPKTQIGVGLHADGGFYLVMLVAHSARGMDVVQQLQAMGCLDAMGGDEDTSTQAVWRGTPAFSHRVREVPNALAVYHRQATEASQP